MSAADAPPAAGVRYPLHGASATPPGGCYAAVRATCPVVRTTLPSGDEIFMVTRYDDARRVLSDPAFGNRLDFASAPRLTAAGSFATEDSIMNMDAPEHTRLRRLIGTAFTPRRVEALRGRIEGIADDLLDSMASSFRSSGSSGSSDTSSSSRTSDDSERAAAAADLIEEFAFPLPMRVICELLGIPAQDRDLFREWSEVIVAPAEHTMDEIIAAHRAGQRQIVALLASRREDPGDDLLSGLIQARDDGDALTEKELIGLTWALVIAGHETTVSLIGGGVVRLLEHPDQLAALRADRTLLPSAVDEILRYDGPVEQATFRIARREVELSGVTVPAGEHVMVVVPAANHDESRFAEPGTFDITRADNLHLTFGYGPHFCPGASLARLEAQIAFDRLFTRFPGLRLAVPIGELEWRHLSTRGPKRLPVTW